MIKKPLGGLPRSVEYERTLMFPACSTEVTDSLLNVCYPVKIKLKKTGALTFVSSHFTDLNERLKGKSIFPFA